MFDYHFTSPDEFIFQVCTVKYFNVKWGLHLGPETSMFCSHLKTPFWKMILAYNSKLSKKLKKKTLKFK